MGEFQVFPVVGKIDQGLHLKPVLSLLVDLLENGICVVEGALVPDFLFLFIQQFPALCQTVGFWNPLVIAEMAAGQVQYNKIVLALGNIFEGR